ncbi:MAG: hypothetical protein AAB215_02160 [Planctomycetota bacterium]
MGIPPRPRPARPLPRTLPRPLSRPRIAPEEERQALASLNRLSWLMAAGMLGLGVGALLTMGDGKEANAGGIAVILLGTAYFVGISLWLMPSIRKLKMAYLDLFMRLMLHPAWLGAMALVIVLAILYPKSPPLPPAPLPPNPGFPREWLPPARQG